RPLLDLHSFPTRRSSDLSISFNGSYMYNKIQFEDERILELSKQGSPVAPTNRSRSLYGASPYLVNLDLSYKADWNKTANTMFTIDRKSTRLNSSHVKISY